MDEPPPTARRVTVTAERLPAWLAGFGRRHGGTRYDADDETVGLTGADGDRAWIRVPFPPLSPAADTHPSDVLLEHVARERRVGVLLVRRHGFAVGVFAGTELVTSKVDSTYVQGTTKAGGWSQQRYARRRTNQAGAAFAKAADTAARVLAGTELDGFVAGGDRPAVHAVLDDPRLAHLVPVGPWLEVKDPKLKVLAATPEQFRAVRIRLDP